MSAVSATKARDTSAGMGTYWWQTASAWWLLTIVTTKTVTEIVKSVIMVISFPRKTTCVSRQLRIAWTKKAQELV